MSKDYYDILGVDRNASTKEIKKQYYKISKEYHPDRNKDVNAEEIFKEASEAYDVLSDDKKRKEYDMFGRSGSNQQSGGFGGFEDIFSQFGDIFGSRGSNRSRPQRRGGDLRVSIDVSFVEVLFGTNKKIKLKRNKKCTPCDGKGGTNIDSCKVCNGTGMRIVIQNTPFGQFQSQTNCDSCDGSGHKTKDSCNSCNGRGYNFEDDEISIDMPAGVDSGMQLTMRDGGNFAKFGTYGDLNIIINVKKDEKYERLENDVIIKKNISISEAVLGTEFEVEYPLGNINLKIPNGCESGKVFTFKNKGVPNLSQNGRIYGNGDLNIIINVTIPKKINNEQKEIFEKLKQFS